MNKPQFSHFGTIAPLLTHEYERYLPTAFDESMSLLQKVNKVIRELNRIGEISNSVIVQWNNVMDWIVNNGLDDVIITQLQKWVEDGTMAEIINEEIFLTKADTVYVNNELAKLVVSINKIQQKLDEDLETFRLNQQGIQVNVMEFGAKGDGVTDDAQAIQNAINAGVGKTVVFPNKTFLMKKYVRVKSNTNIKLNPSTVLKRGSDMTAFFINDSDGTKGGYSANKNIHFEGGTIDINKSQFPSKCTSFGFGHAENISIKNMNFINMWQWHYIEFSGCKNILVDGCTFDGHEQETASEHVQFDVHKSDTTFPWFAPYDGTPCLFGTVRNSLFRNGRRGIGTHSQVDGKSQQNIIIENNRFENMRDYCIGMYDYKDSIVRGNTMIGSHTGVHVLTSVKGATKNIIIENNIMENLNQTEHTRGIHIDDNSENVVIKNNIINNISRHGIGFDRCDFGEVSGNIVTNCGMVGIWLYGSFNISCHGNVVHNNNKLNLDYYDVQCGEEGVRTVSSTDYVITNNNIGRLGLVRTLNCGVFHNHIDSFFIGTISTDLLMKDNCVGGTWV